MTHDNFWPSREAFLDLSGVHQLTHSNACCTGVAICDEKGRPSRAFYQGQAAHFFYEFEILCEIEVPSGGLEIRDATGRVLHGKTTFQYGTMVPRSIRPGTMLRFHQIIQLEVELGEYVFSLGLASTDKAAYDGYYQGRLTHEEFARSVREHCRVMDVCSFVVQFDSAGKLLHHGVANLPGSCQVTVVEAPCGELVPRLSTGKVADLIPTIFHVTHWKAGSQWIHKILRGCIPERVVAPQLGEHQFLYWPLQPGKVYPTVYVTKQQFESVRLPAHGHRFVIIRDLRDTLISAYLSSKISHPVLESGMARWRTHLQSLSLQEGLLYLMDEWLPGCARIQLSWLEAGEQFIRYEDLLEHDLEILESVLLDKCQLQVSRERFREAVLANRFERLTNGRPRGQEDITAHERKGIAGDWRNYFSKRITQAFKARYGGLLVTTGYEKDGNW